MKMYYIVTVLAIVGMLLAACVESGQTPRSTSPTFTCSDYTDEPIAFTRGTGRIDIYGGVDEPRTNDVKGTVDSGAGIAVERKCGSWYRVRGVNWWGWLKSTNVEF